MLLSPEVGAPTFDALFRPIRFGMMALVLCAPSYLAAASEDDLVREAVAYQREGEYRAAMIQLKNALQANPNDVSARLELGRLYLRVGDGAAAEKELNRARRLGAAADTIVVLLGRAYLLQGQSGRVLKDLDVDTTLDASARASVLALQSQAHLLAGDPAAARQAADLALAIRAESPDAWLAQARVALAQGETAEADTSTTKAIEIASDNADAWTLRGDTARLRHDPEAAVLAFQRALEIEPGHLAARLGVASVEVGLGHVDSAQGHLERLRRILPMHPTVNFLTAVLALQRDDLAAAGESLQKVFKVVPDHLPGHLMAGAIDYQEGHLEQAEKHLERYLGAASGSLPALKLLAATRLKNKDPNGAIRALGQAAVHQGGDAQFLVLMGNAYMQLGDFDTGTTYFERAVAIAPDVAAIRTQLALGHLAAGNSDQAVSDLETAVELGEGLVETELLLVMAQLQRKDFGRALEAARQLAARRPKDPVPYNLIGTALAGQGDLPAARKAFGRALSIAPQFAAAEMNLARLDLAEGDRRAARARFQRIIEIDAKHLGAMLGLARLAQSEGDTSGALTWVERAHEADPEAVEPAVLLVRHHLERGEKLRALAVARRLYDGRPQEPAALELLGESQLASGEAGSAVATFRRLVDLMPGLPQVHYLLAKAQVAADETRAAGASLAQALALQSDFLPAQRLSAELAIQDRDLQGALDIAHQVQRQRPRAAAGFVLEAQVYMADQDHARAVPAYSAGYALEKTRGLALGLYDLQRRAGQGAAGMEPLREWLAGHPDDAEVALTLAVALQSGGESEAAIDQYRRVLEIQPDNIVALNNLAWLYHDRDDAQGVVLAARAYALSPELPAVVDTYGWLLMHHGDPRKGLTLVQDAAMHAPHIPSIRYHLAVGLYKDGQHEQARKELQRLLRSEKAFPESDEAEALLKSLSKSE